MRPIDDYSFQLGVIDCFNEMISAGVKNIALSHPFRVKAECEELLEAVSSICSKYKTSYFYEENLLTSDLFPISVTNDCYLYIFYQDLEILTAYQDIKHLKETMILDNSYSAESRLSIATKFGKLLGYTDEKIANLILSNNDKE